MDGRRKTRLSDSCSQRGEEKRSWKLGDSSRAGVAKARGGRRKGRHTFLDNGSAAAVRAISATALKVAMRGDAGVEICV